MTRRRRLFRFLRGDRGQVLPLVVLSAVVLIGFTGFAIDLGRVWVAKQQLQRAIDAATLAAGRDLPNTATALSDAEAYAGTGTRNPVGGWGVTANAPSVTFECVASGPNYSSTTNTCLKDTSGDNCDPNVGAFAANPALPSGSTTCNEVRVTETAKVSTGLLSLFIPNFTVSASSTAAARGETGVPEPMNLFVILDTTESMSDGCSANIPVTTPTDPDATTPDISNPDKIDCAKDGVRSLLQELPFTDGVADDDVGVMVFPALSSTLSATSSIAFTGTVTKNSPDITSTSASLSTYVGTSGKTVVGSDMPADGGTVTSISKSGSTYTIVLSADSTSTSSTPTSVSLSLNTYALAPSATPTTPAADETDCNIPSTTSSSTGYDKVGSTFVTYPPWENPGTGGTVPLGVFSPYAFPGYVDNYPGYLAVPLSSDYLSNGNLNPSSSLVQSVWWSQCKNSTWPGGDYYGVKDFPEDGVTGQGSYLAGAITEAQYVLSQQQQAQPTRTLGGVAYPVSSGIIILSDGELNDPDGTKDGVDPDANGDLDFSSDTPCEDALNAAAAAEAAKTLIFTIAYNDLGYGCDDSGSGTGSNGNGSTDSNSTCPASTYSGSGPFDGAACTMMADLASSSAYVAEQSTAGDLTSVFDQAGTALTGNSVLAPDCSDPPNCT
jgi:Flp pilus assembly protein TadG